jgi:hypothetical protein
MDIVAAIELDDKLRTKGNYKKNSSVRKQAFDKAGIKLIQWKAVALPPDSEILQKILGMAQPKAPKLAIVTRQFFDTENGAHG